MDLFSFIVKVIEVLRDFLIFWSPVKYTLVRDGYQAVKFSFGKAGSPLNVGIHWGTSGETFEKIEVLKIKSNVNQCDSFTKDRIPIRVYGNYTYDIIDASKFLTKSQDAHWLLVEIVEQEIFTWFATQSFDECHKGVIEQKICDELKDSINKQCEKFDLGIKVSFVRISDWQVLDTAMLRCLALEPMLESLNQYEAPNPYLVALVVGSQPVLTLNNSESEVTEETQDI